MELTWTLSILVLIEKLVILNQFLKPYWSQTIRSMRSFCVWLGYVIFRINISFILVAVSWLFSHINLLWGSMFASEWPSQKGNRIHLLILHTSPTKPRLNNTLRIFDSKSNEYYWCPKSNSIQKHNSEYLDNLKNWSSALRSRICRKLTKVFKLVVCFQWIVSYVEWLMLN